MKVLITLALSISILISLFQSCGPQHSESLSLEQSSTTPEVDVEVSQPFLNQNKTIQALLPKSQIVKSTDLTFATPVSADDKDIVRLFWDHTLNATDYCRQVYGDIASEILINCANSGTLRLTLYIEKSNGDLETEVAEVEIYDTPTEPAPTEPEPPVTGPPVEYDGKTLFKSSCVGCHSVSEVAGSSQSHIQTQIDNNIGGMGILNRMKPEEIKAIADYLQ